MLRCVGAWHPAWLEAVACAKRWPGECVCLPSTQPCCQASHGTSLAASRRPSLSLLQLLQAGCLMPDFSGTSLAQECLAHFQQLSPGAEATPELQEMLLEQGWVELHYRR